ncbi:MAG: heat-inducible transcriptional repressor HrcA [Chloroflexota bacterium]
MVVLNWQSGGGVAKGSQREKSKGHNDRDWGRGVGWGGVWQRRIAMMTSRREKTLKIIVERYVAGAVPVGSQSIARSQLTVSPATARNDMAYLEREGFIARSYSSAGSVPTDKGYRYYVETQLRDIEFSQPEREWIRRTFLESLSEVEQWVTLVARLLARVAHNAAIVTLPKPATSRFRRLELIALSEFLASLILVLQQAKVKQQLLYFNGVVTQEKLTRISSRLNAAYTGQTAAEIESRRVRSSSPELHMASDAVLSLMRAEDVAAHGLVHVEGLGLMLGQPEFVERGRRMLDVVELIEESGQLGALMPPPGNMDEVKAIIGREITQGVLQDLSLVYGSYGSPSQGCGAVAVLGPTRMDYRRTISAVRCLTQLMTQYMAGPGDQPEN